MTRNSAPAAWAAGSENKAVAASAKALNRAGRRDSSNMGGLFSFNSNATNGKVRVANANAEQAMSRNTEAGSVAHHTPSAGMTQIRFMGCVSVALGCEPSGRHPR